MSDTIVTPLARAEQPETFAARDGAMLAYRHYRAAEPKAVVIVLPGFALESRDYTTFCRTLAHAGLTLYSPDLRGHGDSEGRPDDVDYVGQLTEDLVDLCAHVRDANPDVPLILCAHSSGCSLAIASLSDPASPVGVSGLFLIAPVFCGTIGYDRNETRIYRFTHLCRYFRLPDRIPPLRKAALPGHQFRFRLWASLFGRLLPGYQRQIVLEVDTGRSDGYRRFTRRFYDSYRCPDLPNRLSTLACPTWAVVGSDDEFSIPDAVASTLRWHVPPRLLRDVRILNGVRHFTIILLASVLLVRCISSLPEVATHKRNAV